MRRRPRAGLTLLEILVAISLLSLLSVGILMALRVAVGGWQRAHQSLMLDRRIAAASQVLQGTLENILAVRGAYRLPQTEGFQTFLFFHGQPLGMRFVTSYGLERGPRAGLRLVELMVADGPRGKRVLMNDFPYDGPAMTAPLVTGVLPDSATGGMRLIFAPVLAQPSSFILADELAAGSFSYYFQERAQAPGQWIPEWPRSNLLPSAVRVEMTPRAETARLRPVSITAPVRARVLP